MSRKTALTAIWLSRWELILRWGLGMVFIYAGFHKVVDPAGFARIIYGYNLFPAAIINLSAIVLPFVELFSGLLLVMGLYPKPSALVINLFLAIFITAISINLFRGYEFDCGCFSTAASTHFSSALGLLVRDLLMLFAGVFIFLFSGKRLLSLKK